MQNLLFTYLTSFWDIFKNVWYWMLIGMLISAFVREFVPVKKMLEYFGGNDWKSLGRATISGLFVSVCSCGAVPIASTLRERGASTASTLTFLLASPWAGFIHLFILSSFIGIKYTLLLFVIALAVAFISGLALARLENKNKITPGIPRKHKDHEDHKCVECAQLEEAKRGGEPLKRRIIYNVPKHLWGIFIDVGKYMFIGLFTAAALKAFIPVGLVTQYLGGGKKFLPVLIAVPISTIIELSGEGFILLAGQLYEMGASLGVVFTMVMVGVSTDLTEISMIIGKFGKRTALAYASISLVLVIGAAMLINSLV
ncbi:permease [Candidatus Woesearchaeota archaeon]|nr:permease [Candidatus Woesearchaeota archaeon]